MPSTAGIAIARHGGDRAVRAAVVAQLVLAVYLQLIEWVPMPPWNDLSRGNGQERLDLILAAVMLALVVGTARRSRAAMALAVVALAGWLALQIQSGWVPDFTGGSPGGRRPDEVWVARHDRVLPAIGDHPVPDAAHVVLHVLIAVALVLTVRALLARSRHA